ncbi:class I SAM-dependent methyltransferase [Plantactinospora sp. WMMB782]|uniref:class I SAM-dependent methyltransferase n=1 Tax=Plantactinospora sp. WMMB782 TaxID=3404121 RepID=UPI003B92C7F7
MSQISTAGASQRDAGVVTAAQLTDQVAFLSDWLPPAPARVLDAGCGRGDLARALARDGYAVLGVDVDPLAVGAAATRGVAALVADLADYRDEHLFDAVVCSLSLHHMRDLAGAVRRAWSLLRPGGILVVDEFAWERADAGTAAWYHDTAALLAAAGRPGPEPDVTPVATPHDHWVRRHRDEQRMHPGEAIVDEIARHFDIRETVRVPYLHRYLSQRLDDDADGLATFTVLRQIERLRVADGSLTAVGLRLLAQARTEGN